MNILPGKFHGQRNLAGYSPRGHKESDTTGRLTPTHTHSSKCLSPRHAPHPQASLCSEILLPFYLTVHSRNLGSPWHPSFPPITKSFHMCLLNLSLIYLLTLSLHCCHPKTKPEVLTRKRSGPARDMWNCLETSMVVTTWGEEATSIKWAGATDGALHLTGCTTVPPTKEWSSLSHQQHWGWETLPWVHERVKEWCIPRVLFLYQLWSWKNDHNSE